MKHRHVRWLWWLLILIAVEGMGQDSRQAMAQGGELPPLPPDPADWVCQDSLTAVSQAAIDAWCSSNVNRGLPTPATLQIPPPLANLLAKDIFAAFQGFLRSRVYDTVLGWKHDLNWRLTGPYVGTIGSGLSLGVHPAVRVYYSPEMID